MHCESEKGIRGTHSHCTKRTNEYVAVQVGACERSIIIFVVVGATFFRGFIIVCVDLATART